MWSTQHAPKMMVPSLMVSSLKVIRPRLRAQNSVPGQWIRIHFVSPCAPALGGADQGWHRDSSLISLACFQRQLPSGHALYRQGMIRVASHRPSYLVGYTWLYTVFQGFPSWVTASNKQPQQNRVCAHPGHPWSLPWLAWFRASCKELSAYNSQSLSVRMCTRTLGIFNDNE